MCYAGYLVVFRCAHTVQLYFVLCCYVCTVFAVQVFFVVCRYVCAAEVFLVVSRSHVWCKVCMCCVGGLGFSTVCRAVNAPSERFRVQ